MNQPNLVSLEARPASMVGRGAVTIRDLVKDCLRMRPDRINNTKAADTIRALFDSDPKA